MARDTGHTQPRLAVEVLIDIGALEDCPSHTLPGFTDRLLAWLPGLHEHHCGLGYRGGFVERLRDGALSIAVAMSVPLCVICNNGQKSTQLRLG